MAESWLRYFGGPSVEVFSAGTKPKGVHPKAISCMAQAGVDISGHTSDHVSDYADQDFDLVVTVCGYAKEACPAFPNAKRVIHHPFDDPDTPCGSESEQDALFIRVRDEIRDWAEALIKEL